jgi:hypothetical protein
MDDLVLHIKQELLSLGEDSEKFVGCTHEQIEEIMQKQGVSRLPGLYRDFMLEMGHGAGTLFRGSSFYYGAMMYFNFKEEAQTLLNEVGIPFQIPEKAFVFLSHGGYIFFYFDTEASDYDPIMVRFIEGDPIPKSVGKLSELLLEEIELHKKLLKGRTD